ncbi:MAG TPA: UvrD-helicase domain-containing protein, partial [Pseudomonadaceae bacterium]|nr:UvrD-helicase domain-containing protein [Pseudomonadaceae bacterium]
MSHKASDADTRLRALDPEHSFCVQAPAGSGKTELLTQRILRLLAYCERPEEILAITFTRKAAAEMRNRLLSSLEQANALDDAGLAALPAHKRLTMDLARTALARDAMCGWQLLQQPQRLRINTIDSFTSWLTTRLPMDAGFGASPEISTDMDPIFRQAVHETLAVLEQKNESAEHVASLLRHVHGNLARAEALLMALLGRRDQWLQLLVLLRSDPQQARHLLEKGLQTLLQETYEDASFQLVALEMDIMRLLHHAADNDHAAVAAAGFGSTLPATHADAREQWQAMARLFLLSDRKGFLSKPNKRHGFPAPSSTKDPALKNLYSEMHELYASTVARLQESTLLPLLQRLAAPPPAAYEDQHWEVLEHCIALLPVLAARLAAAMRSSGIVDHVQTSLASLQALGTASEPTDLALRLDYFIRHILVDEFQDTSSMQFELLTLLTAGWAPGDGKTLFIVGDGMQSCYRFRNADVSLFMKAREQVGALPMELLELEVNFRSAAPVVNWINDIFSRAFPASDDSAHGGVSYSPSKAAREGDEMAGIRTRLFVHPEGPRDLHVLRSAQAQEIASLCARLQHEHPQDRVAILVRNRNSLNALVPELRKLGLRWNAEDIDPLLSHAPVRDLFTLLRALLNISDISAWLALLRCPFVGLTLPDLERAASLRLEAGDSLLATLLRAVDESAWDKAALSDDARQRLRRVLPALQRARSLLQVLPLAELLEQLWLELGGAACLADHALLETIETFFRQVEAAAPHGDVLDIQALQERLERSRSSTRDDRVKLQIMTIHKAKGLEFEHVILPDLDRQPRRDDPALLLWQEYRDRQLYSWPLLALMRAKGKDADPLYDYLNADAALRDAYETTRLSYIAVTRAIRSAWLFGAVTATPKGESYNARSGSLLATMLPALLARQDDIDLEFIETVPRPEASGSTSHSLPELPFRRLPADWQAPFAGLLLREPREVKAPEPTHDLLAAAIGEIVHLCLQLVVSQGQDFPPERRPAWWLSRLRPLCSNAERLDAAIDKVRQQLQNCLQGEDAPWLFRTRHREDVCELALSDYH